MCEFCPSEDDTRAHCNMTSFAPKHTAPQILRYGKMKVKGKFALQRVGDRSSHNQRSGVSG